MWDISNVRTKTETNKIELYYFNDDKILYKHLHSEMNAENKRRADRMSQQQETNWRD